jgi:hypothetical protein
MGEDTARSGYSRYGRICKVREPDDSQVVCVSGTEKQRVGLGCQGGGQGEYVGSFDLGCQ